MTVHQRSPSILTELERIYKEEWQRIPKSRSLSGAEGRVQHMFQLPEEEESLLSLLYQVLDLLSVVGLIIVRYEGPTMVVSSANFTMVFVEWMAEQSLMKRVKRAGLSTQPCGVPVLRTSVEDVLSPDSHHLRPVGEEVPDPMAQR
ncbi:hypothetical protein L3Q82_009683 [Scortum barcoo]|uniref:Uncharacterized protein n=1 Tax=Scortum barcoo TaxID=214431 RepID=A0ACB8WH35_9TELE|nr:hypothetical protein L3Q82_009683 [Scortum barcoo]